MRFLRTVIVITLMMLIAACSGGASEPTAVPSLTPFPPREAQATRTPFSNPVITATPLTIDNQSAPTVILPATSISAGNNSNGDRLLTNGRGISNSANVTNGEFQVEGYCSLLNSEYGVSVDGTDWYCTFQGQRALTLRQEHFNDICQRTYSNINAVALRVNNGQTPAYQWRCYELAIAPTPTSSVPPRLLNNGRGLSTGAVMNNGEVEVEGYCSSINSNYGVDVDQNFWYCTENGNRILTLGVAEFDDVCIRTYNNAAAYSEQIQNNDRPAYRWRCFEIPS